MTSFLVGRQPIFNAVREVRGYELLFRGPDGLTGDAMTADVLVRAGLDLGLSNLVGNKAAFVNVTRPYLVGEQAVPLPPGQTVLEVLDSVPRDAEVLAGCRRLRQEGYTVALDGYDWSKPEDPLVEVASMIKLDVLEISPAVVVAEAARLIRYPVELVAVKVETVEQLALCQDQGFSLFQGYLLARPEVVDGASLSPGKLTCLRVINELCNPGVDAGDIQQVVEADAGLSYRFLRLAGEGAAQGLYRPVRSVKEGVVLLGFQRLRAWVTLMLLSGAAGVSSEQLHIGMTRARMAELLGAEVAPGLADPAFTVGLVSALELLLSAPLSEILEKLGLAEEISTAVAERAGPLGAILDDVVSWQLGAFSAEVRSGLPLATLERAYIEALSWATESCSIVGAAGAVA